MKSVKCIAIGTFNTSQGRATAPGYVRTMLSVYTDNADFQFMLSQAIIKIYSSLFWFALFLDNQLFEIDVLIFNAN